MKMRQCRRRPYRTTLVSTSTVPQGRRSKRTRTEHTNLQLHPFRGWHTTADLPYPLAGVLIPTQPKRCGGCLHSPCNSKYPDNNRISTISSSSPCCSYSNSNTSSKSNKCVCMDNNRHSMEVRHRTQHPARRLWITPPAIPPTM